MIRVGVAVWVSALGAALALAGCGKYGPPVRGGESGNGVREAPAAAEPAERRPDEDGTTANQEPRHEPSQKPEQEPRP